MSATIIAGVRTGTILVEAVDGSEFGGVLINDEFDYYVMAVRAGHTDYRVVRPPLGSVHSRILEIAPPPADRRVGR